MICSFPGKTVKDSLLYAGKEHTCLQKIAMLVTEAKINIKSAIFANERIKKKFKIQNMEHSQ